MTLAFAIPGSRSERFVLGGARTCTSGAAAGAWGRRTLAAAVGVWSALVRRLRPAVGVPVADRSDAELLGGCESDPAAFRELVARHQVSLRRLARSMMRNDADADEVVQDAFLAAHRHHGSFRGESSVRSWLHSICYRHCLARLRRARLQLVPLDSVAERAGTDAVEDPSFGVAMEAAMAGLPHANRAAFVLVDVLGLTREEAAQVIGVPSNTMRARVARARVLLADQWATDAEVRA